jgi:hypothetical protein
MVSTSQCVLHEGVAKAFLSLAYIQRTRSTPQVYVSPDTTLSRRIEGNECGVAVDLHKGAYLCLYLSLIMLKDVGNVRAGDSRAGGPVSCSTVRDERTSEKAREISWADVAKSTGGQQRTSRNVNVSRDHSLETILLAK